jgi:hypothetical protein
MSRLGRLKHEMYIETMFAGPRVFYYWFCFFSSSC